MKWKLKRILFYLFSNKGGVDRHSMQQIAMAATNSVEESYALIKQLLKEGHVIREKSKFKLAPESTELIERLYVDVENLMQKMKERLQNNLGDRVEIKGGVTGLYFTYTNKLHMFRFHPEEHKGDLLIRVRLPNLIGEVLDNKSNELYLSKKVLMKTAFIETVINAHLEMIDVLNAQEMVL